MTLQRALWIVFIISILTHFAFFGHPNQAVFDEVHFGKFISGYYTGEYFFDIHPPLGKLMIAGFGSFFGFKPSFSFATIGDAYPNATYKALRFLPSLAGALLAPLLVLLSRRLGMSVWTALFVGLFVSVENALITQSRYILLDAFLLLFGFTALLLYLHYRKTRGVRSLVGAGIFLGCAVSIKWTALSFLGLIVLLEATDIFRKRSRVFSALWALVIVPILVYGASFALHLSLLDRSGPGDAFMSPAFQKSLAGNIYANDVAVTPLSFPQKLIELNSRMYTANQHLIADHPYGSVWYTWPFMQRSVYYWVHDDQRVYFLGNPIIWWVSTLVLTAFILHFLIIRTLPPLPGSILLVGYAGALIPFIGIGRVMFLYHYLTALVFAILLFAYAVEYAFERSRRVLVGVFVIAIAAFIFFAPLTYGISLPQEKFQNRLWLRTWLW